MICPCKGRGKGLFVAPPPETQHWRRVVIWNSQTRAVPFQTTKWINFMNNIWLMDIENWDVGISWRSCKHARISYWSLQTVLCNSWNPLIELQHEKAVNIYFIQSGFENCWICPFNQFGFWYTTWLNQFCGATNCWKKVMTHQNVFHQSETGSLMSNEWW